MNLQKATELRKHYFVLPNYDKNWQKLPPYHIVDARTAEPDVNWPGELVAGPFQDPEVAELELTSLIIKAALDAPVGT